MRPRHPPPQRLPPHVAWAHSPRDGGGVADRPPLLLADRGGPQGSVEGHYEYYGPPQRRYSPGEPLHPRRRCDGAPGIPLLRMPCFMRRDEMEWSNKPSLGPSLPPRLIPHRLVGPPLVQRLQEGPPPQSPEAMCRPSHWQCRRRSGSRGSSCRGLGSHSHRGVSTDGERSRSRSVSTISVNEPAAESPGTEGSGSVSQRDQQRAQQRVWQERSAAFSSVAVSAGGSKQSPEGPLRRSLSRASDVSALSSCRSRSRSQRLRRWQQQQRRGMLRAVPPALRELIELDSEEVEDDEDDDCLFLGRFPKAPETEGGPAALRAAGGRREAGAAPLLADAASSSSSSSAAAAARAEEAHASEEALQALQQQQHLWWESGFGQQEPQQQGTPAHVLQQLPALPFKSRPKASSSRRSSGSSGSAAREEGGERDKCRDEAGFQMKWRRVTERDYARGKGVLASRRGCRGDKLLEEAEGQDRSADRGMMPVQLKATPCPAESSWCPETFARKSSAPAKEPDFEEGIAMSGKGGVAEMSGC
ncbi:hypothetical protein cyc_06219 [Cyclospora cayetanensis]|uniref:Uncharacterized protein n=1 Tax=Cyclospora cayetanensis TaxID=88456 RepID=A0A1D3D7I1_9EIME|nr:hypothetical protein cyc_06219 [Cyclospora cayetanensis]